MAEKVASTTTPPGSKRTETSASEPADLLLRRGKIITADTAFSIEQAIAIRGERILAVGSDVALDAHVGPSTRVIDVGGRTVIPGMVDAHAHMDREALRDVFPTLGRVRSIRDIQDRIAELARSKRPGEWIVTMPIGDAPYYFNVPEILAEKRWPTRQELDIAAPNNPVYIRSIWGYWRHTFPLVSCANTEALRRAGISRDTVSPVPTLTIERDSAGDPTGVFLEDEFNPVAELIWFRQAAAFTHADRVRAMPASARAYHAFGTTSIFEGHGVATELLRAYQETHRSGALSMRASLAFSPNWDAVGNPPLKSFVQAWCGWLGGASLGDDWLKMSGLYVKAGRSPADNARATAAPYTGWAGFNYACSLPRDRAKELLLECAANDIRVVMIGSASLSLYEEVDREISLKGRRWVLSHVEILSPRDVEAIARMEIIVTTHTNEYLYKGLTKLTRHLPPERHGEINPLRSLTEAGVKVCLATDNVPCSLFMPMSQAIARVPFGLKEPVAPEEGLSRTDALRCVTTNGAYLTFDEDKKGSLEPGKLADLAVLSDDPLTVAQEGLPEIRALLTIAGGRTVHDAQDWMD